LREIERRLGLADRLAACANDPRMPERVRHRLAEIIRFRMLMNAAGYEHGNDADALRRDPMFKLALDRLPSAKELSSHSTISRLENLPDTRALLRLGRGLDRAVLRLDPAGAKAHRARCRRHLRPRPRRLAIAAVQRPPRRLRLPADCCNRWRRPFCHRCAALGRREIRAFLRRLVGAIRRLWLRVAVLLRVGGHYACPEVFD
jgi:Transposase DDE domain group 1